MQFSTGGGISSLSPSSRDAVVDPIAELLSQLSGVRRGAGQPGTPQPTAAASDAAAARTSAGDREYSCLDREAAAGTAAAARRSGRWRLGLGAASQPAAARRQHSHNRRPNTPIRSFYSPASSASSDSQAGPEVESRAALLRGLVLASLGRAAPADVAPPTAPAPPAPPAPREGARARAAPPHVCAYKPQPRTNVPCRTTPMTPPARPCIRGPYSRPIRHANSPGERTSVRRSRRTDDRNQITIGIRRGTNRVAPLRWRYAGGGATAAGGQVGAARAARAGRPPAPAGAGGRGWGRLGRSRRPEPTHETIRCLLVRCYGSPAAAGAASERT
ncbi:unnamed protein product [Arctia plantaginis]|uniref:Uncharacterized protein n=1 Tax=Arctia plantaginis TaxID=874455 RepID=A0A8S0ZWC6_ARCPL|nr:unnamed protein product [Arctia plantaginis]